MSAFRTTRRVEFCDTDAAGIVHFSRFFIYMETAEHDLLRSLGLSVLMPHGDDADRHLSWPRVSATCDYQSPARFGDELTIEVEIERLGVKSVAYRHRFLRGDQLLAVGKMTAVCCILQHGVKPQSIPIPDWIVAKLTPWVAASAS